MIAFKKYAVVGAILFFGVTLLSSAYSLPADFGTQIFKKEKTFIGYTLLFSVGGKPYGEDRSRVSLIDMAGKEVHRWTMGEGIHVTGGKLLPDGTLFMYGRKNGLDPGVAGSIIQELAWDGSVLWEYTGEEWHHEVDRLPNGNIVGLKYVPMRKSEWAKLKGGIEGTEFYSLKGVRNGDSEGVIYSDAVIEIDRITKKPIWEWQPEDSLNVADYPLEPLEKRKEWTHANSLRYLPSGNPLTGGEGYLVSFRQISLVVAVEKATKKVRWEFGPGETNKQHDATLLPNGNVLIFNNGMHRPGTDPLFGFPASSVIEVDPATKQTVWFYKGIGFGGIEFLSPLWGGAQRLSNGNTLITEGVTGRVFEVDSATSTSEDGKTGIDPHIVWEYVSPYVGSLPQGRTLSKATRYSRDEIQWPANLPLPEGETTKMNEALKKFNPNSFLVVSIALNLVLIFTLFREKRG